MAHWLLIIMLSHGPLLIIFPSVAQLQIITITANFKPNTNSVSCPLLLFWCSKLNPNLLTSVALLGWGGTRGGPKSGPKSGLIRGLRAHLGPPPPLPSVAGGGLCGRAGPPELQRRAGRLRGRKGGGGSGRRGGRESSGGNPWENPGSHENPWEEARPLLVDPVETWRAIPGLPGSIYQGCPGNRGNPGEASICVSECW